MELTVEHVQKTTDFKTRKYAEGAIEALKWLELGAPHQLDGLKGRFHFDMNEFISPVIEYKDKDDYEPEHCGTVCCIAGAVYAFSKNMNGDRKREKKGPYELNSSFGLTTSFWYNEDSAPLARLFYAILPDGNQYTDMDKISPAHAAKALRVYLETGVVDWGHLED